MPPSVDDTSAAATGSMKAAVVRAFGALPRLEEVPLPHASGPETFLARVRAAALHPRVRSGASGTHYATVGELPMIPGVDGVAELDDGTCVYFVASDEVWGSFAEYTLVDRRRMVPLPQGVDLVKVAAGMNPAMSSWMALRRRVELKPGQSVLVVGATGSAGALAVQIAKLLGAGRVIGAGRNPDRLAPLRALGADVVVPLGGIEALAGAAADVDVVLDYLWGEPATSSMTAILKARPDRSQPLDWVQIGAVAGSTIELPSAVLRSANLRLQGCGQGSVSLAEYRSELPALIEALDAGSLIVRTREVPLSEVHDAWSTEEAAGVRTVLVS